MSKSSKKLRLTKGSTTYEYPLFTKLEDIKDSHGHYIKVTNSSTTYYARLVKASTANSTVSLNVKALGNTNFPNVTPTVNITTGHLKAGDYILSSSEVSVLGCDCDCTLINNYYNNCYVYYSDCTKYYTNCYCSYTNCYSGKTWYDNSNYKVQNSWSGTSTSNLGFGSRWVNGSNCTTTSNGHAYGYRNWSVCSSTQSTAGSFTYGLYSSTNCNYTFSNECTY